MFSQLHVRPFSTESLNSESKENLYGHRQKMQLIRFGRVNKYLPADVDGNDDGSLSLPLPPLEAKREDF